MDFYFRIRPISGISVTSNLKVAKRECNDMIRKKLGVKVCLHHHQHHMTSEINFVISLHMLEGWGISESTALLPACCTVDFKFFLMSRNILFW